MATGTRPKWGDGQSDPAVLDCEATLNSEYFDPNLRDAMLEFFDKALRRDHRERFDNCEEMLRAWRRVFENADEVVAGTATDEGFDRKAAIYEATFESPVIALGLTTRAANALDRLNVITVEDLLRVQLQTIYHLGGVGHKTRLEIAALVNELKEAHPDWEMQPQVLPDSETDTDGAEPEVASCDLIAQQVARVGSRDKNETEKKILHAFTGWDAVGKFSVFDLYTWPSQADLARYFAVQRARVEQSVGKARERWRRNPSLTALRKTIADIVEAQGGAITNRELIAAVLVARGSGMDEPARSQLASVITRAAIEAERTGETPRFVDRRVGTGILITRDSQTADYVERLARAADELARLDPIPTPARTLETLRNVTPVDGAPLLSDARLVQLAVAASEGAAVSSRMEIYPRGLEAIRALRLAHGALFGVKEFSVDELKRRVAGRYPDAEALPDRPELDCLLTEVELDLQWAPEKNAYCYQYQESRSGLSSSTHPGRFPTRIAAAPAIAEVAPAIADAQVFEDKLRRANEEGAFLALSVAPRDFLDAEAELLRRFDLERRNLDELLIGAMHEQARIAGADWNVVLQADATLGTPDWQKLLFLVGRSLPAVERALSESDKTLLLVYPGLLARYNKLDLVDRLRDKIGTSQSSLHGLWLLLPADGQVSRPIINGAPVPVISASQWARIPEAWLRNEHRAGGSGGVGE
jgi:hypothetical protein